MAIIANSDGAMARLQPAAKLVLHDMTIHTRFGVVSHVRVAASINEGVRTDTCRHAERDTQDYSTPPPFHFVTTVSGDIRRIETSKCLLN